MGGFLLIIKEMGIYWYYPNPNPCDCSHNVLIHKILILSKIRISLTQPEEVAWAQGGLEPLASNSDSRFEGLKSSSKDNRLTVFTWTTCTCVAFLNFQSSGLKLYLLSASSFLIDPAGLTFLVFFFCRQNKHLFRWKAS